MERSLYLSWVGPISLVLVWWLSVLEHAKALSQEMGLAGVLIGSSNQSEGEVTVFLISIVLIHYPFTPERFNLGQALYPVLGSLH